MVKQTGCVKQTDKKYTERPSPPYAAQECYDGLIKMGNDGYQWQIVANKNGVKRWKKMATSTSTKSRKASKVRKSRKTSKVRKSRKASKVRKSRKASKVRKSRKVRKATTNSRKATARKEKVPCKEDQYRDPETGKCKKRPNILNQVPEERAPTLSVGTIRENKFGKWKVVEKEVHGRAWGPEMVKEWQRIA